MNSTQSKVARKQTATLLTDEVEIRRKHRTRSEVDPERTAMDRNEYPIRPKKKVQPFEGTMDF